MGSDFLDGCFWCGVDDILLLVWACGFVDGCFWWRGSYLEGEQVSGFLVFWVQGVVLLLGCCIL